MKSREAIKLFNQNRSLFLEISETTRSACRSYQAPTIHRPSLSVRLLVCTFAGLVLAGIVSCSI